MRPSRANRHQRAPRNLVQGAPLLAIPVLAFAQGTAPAPWNNDAIGGMLAQAAPPTHPGTARPAAVPLSDLHLGPNDRWTLAHVTSVHAGIRAGDGGDRTSGHAAHVTAARIPHVARYAAG